MNYVKLCETINAMKILMPRKEKETWRSFILRCKLEGLITSYEAGIITSYIDRQLSLDGYVNDFE